MARIPRGEIEHLNGRRSLSVGQNDGVTPAEAIVDAGTPDGTRDVVMTADGSRGGRSQGMMLDDTDGHLHPLIGLEGEIDQSARTVDDETGRPVWIVEDAIGLARGLRRLLEESFGI